MFLQPAKIATAIVAGAMGATKKRQEREKEWKHFQFPCLVINDVHTND
jgi:hypothetical protein